MNREDIINRLQQLMENKYSPSVNAEENSNIKGKTVENVYITSITVDGLQSEITKQEYQSLSEAIASDINSRDFNPDKGIFDINLNLMGKHYLGVAEFEMFDYERLNNRLLESNKQLARLMTEKPSLQTDGRCVLFFINNVLASEDEIIDLIPESEKEYAKELLLKIEKIEELFVANQHYCI